MAEKKIASRKARGKKRGGVSSEQLTFPAAEWEKFDKTPLGEACREFAGKHKEIELLEKALEPAEDKVLIEMKKLGKTLLRPQIDGVFYDFEIKKTEKEKLVFKRATA